MATPVPAASSDGEAILEPEDNLESDFCKALDDSPEYVLPSQHPDWY